MRLGIPHSISARYPLPRSLFQLGCTIINAITCCLIHLRGLQTVHGKKKHRQTCGTGNGTMGGFVSHERGFNTTLYDIGRNDDLPPCGRCSRHETIHLALFFPLSKNTSSLQPLPIRQTMVSLPASRRFRLLLLFPLDTFSSRSTHSLPARHNYL